VGVVRWDLPALDGSACPRPRSRSRAATIPPGGRTKVIQWQRFAVSDLLGRFASSCRTVRGTASRQGPGQFQRTGEYLPILAHTGSPRFRFWPRSWVERPGEQEANSAFVDGKKQPFAQPKQDYARKTGCSSADGLLIPNPLRALVVRLRIASGKGHWLWEPWRLSLISSIDSVCRGYRAAGSSCREIFDDVDMPKVEVRTLGAGM
jgi:hypothetical protein